MLIFPFLVFTIQFFSRLSICTRECLVCGHTNDYDSEKPNFNGMGIDGELVRLIFPHVFWLRFKYLKSIINLAYAKYLRHSNVF